MNIWITTVGSSPFAVINAIWAACELENYIPDKVYLIFNYKMKNNFEENKKWLLRLIKEYGKDVTILEKECDEEKFLEYSKLVHSIIFEEKQNGNTVAIDITPGRKIMSAFSMHHGLSEGGADKVYYLHLYDVQKYGNRSFIEIPAIEQKLINMREMV